MSQSAFLPEITRHYPTLTPAEKRIADYVLQYPSEAVSLSAGSLAQCAGTAPSAVIRFCRSLGYDGYSSFKVQLAVALSRQTPASYMGSAAKGDSTSVVLDKIFTANIKALQDTASRLDRQAFEKTVDLISHARCVYIYGIATSSSMVSELQHRLMLLGFPCQSFTDTVSMRLSTINIGPEDVAIGISHSGRTAATVDALALSKEAGAKTVCLTSYNGSPITAVSDLVLTVYCDETQYPIEAAAARIAQTCVIDALVAALSVQHYDEAAARSRKIHDLIEPVRYRRKKR